MSAREQRQPRLVIPAALAQREGAMLYRAASVARAMAEERIRGHGIDVRQFGLLTALVGSGAMSQADLGDALGVDRTTMVALVDELEKAGLVRRERNADDRRAYSVTLTPEGKRLQRRAERTLDQVADEFFGRLTRHDRELLQVFLARLLEARS